MDMNKLSHQTAEVMRKDSVALKAELRWLQALWLYAGGLR